MSTQESQNEKTASNASKMVESASPAAGAASSANAASPADSANPASPANSASPAPDFSKVGIIGSGLVGSTTAFALMQRGLFSEMVLIDVDQSRAEGEALDIAHGMPLASPVNIHAGSYDDIADAGIVIITAGANRKPGETRLDLVNKNVDILKGIVPEIKKRAFGGIILVVSNPVDVLTYVTLKLSGLPANRVIGSGTVLDTARFKYILGEHLGVDPRNVHARIIGEHGDSEIAVWSLANISGIPLDAFSDLRGREHSAETMAQLEERVRTAAHRVIEGKGATYYGIAMSVKHICEAIVRDEKPILAVSSLIEGEYGIEDVCLSIPGVVGKDGIEYKVPAPYSDEEQERLRTSAAKLRKVIEQIEL